MNNRLAKTYMAVNFGEAECYENVRQWTWCQSIWSLVTGNAFMKALEKQCFSRASEARRGARVNVAIDIDLSTPGDDVASVLAKEKDALARLAGTDMMVWESAWRGLSDLAVASITRGPLGGAVCLCKPMNKTTLQNSLLMAQMSGKEAMPVAAAIPPPSQAELAQRYAGDRHNTPAGKLGTLLSMGFGDTAANPEALRVCDGNVELAVNYPFDMG
ncbi:Ubiquilin-4, partial [Perkinsus olseni]